MTSESLCTAVTLVASLLPLVKGAISRIDRGNVATDLSKDAWLIL